ncbi:MAG: T9SS type A sorting domain-containing protein [Taibaiella sp.]|nr:T9SS type A sorting domain-containing protein [Taibaiella sp.]
MKRIFILMSLAATLLVGKAANAQSFSAQNDTVYLNLNLIDNVHNNIVNNSSNTVEIEWKAIQSNFPSDWSANTGICDNVNCITGNGIWSPTTATLNESTSSTSNDFRLQVALGATPTHGTYYMKVKLTNKAVPNDTAIVTFIVSKNATSVSSVKASGDISIYPNPALNALNVVYSSIPDVKNIAIYSIIGRQMNMYRVTNESSASLNVETLPSGIYFIRLINSRGDVVTTRKFTKQ